MFQFRRLLQNVSAAWHVSHPLESFLPLNKQYVRGSIPLLGDTSPVLGLQAAVWCSNFGSSQFAESLLLNGWFASFVVFL